MYRATTSYIGCKPTISLEIGDELSAVHAVDDSWLIGHNERSGETGAFPAALVTSLQEHGKNVKSEQGTDKSILHEKPEYANISKQIQEQIAARTLSAPIKPTPPQLDEGTRPRKSGKSMLVRNPVYDVADQDGSNIIEGHYGDNSEQFPTQGLGETLQRVRFESIKLEHSISTPESWHDSSFENSNQLANYDGYYDDDTNEPTGPVKGSSHRIKLSGFKSSTENLLSSERDEMRGVKAVLGLLGGLLLGACMFIIYRYIFGYTLEEVGLTVSVITCLLCLCLALSSFLRHVVLLVIPNFFTGTGRAVMLSAIFALIVQYPVTNIAHNARETGSSMSCIMDIAVNQSEILERQLVTSLQEISEYVDRQEQLLKESTREMQNAVDSTKAIIDKIDQGGADATAAAEVLRKECTRSINDVKTKCLNLCAGSTFPLKELCEGTLCEVLHQSSGACDGLHVDGALSVIKEARTVLQDAVDYFAVDIEVRGYFQGEVNTSQQTSDIQKQVEEDIGAKLDVFHTVSSIILKCLPIPLLVLVFVQSFWYLRNYLAKDGYDNVYITKQFQQLDKSLGENCILPLKKRERDTYVNTRSFKLNQTELSYCWIGLVQVGFQFLLYVFVTLFDYALYHILHLIKQHGNIELNVNTDSKLTINVEGTGPAAEFYRIMVQGYDHDKTLNTTFDIEPCLPHPQEPTHWMIPVFIIMYLATVAVVILRAYGMRLRRKCAANYCPEQEMARLDYLHKRIRHKRIGFLKFIRHRIKSAHKQTEVQHRLNFTTWLTSNFTLCEMILPKKELIECTSCEQHETSFNNLEITKCPGTKYGSQRCEAAYCRECLEALQNICPLCSDKNDVHLR